MSSDMISSMVEKSVDSKYAKISGIFKSRKRSISRDVSEMQKQTYYMKNLEYHLKFDTNSEYCKKVRLHLEETIAAMKLMSQMRKPSDETISKSQFRLIPNDTVKGLRTSTILVTQTSTPSYSTWMKH